jgi:hypothetical protein
MTSSVPGIHRLAALVLALAVVGLAAPASVSAEPPPPPPNPDLLISHGSVRNTSTPAQRDGGYGLGVAPIGINAWMDVTNQWR